MDLVYMTVATALAVSWKPFTNSNANATSKDSATKNIPQTLKAPAGKIKSIYSPFVLITG
jgi:hypothetical protein